MLRLGLIMPPRKNLSGQLARREARVPPGRDQKLATGISFAPVLPQPSASPSAAFDAELSTAYVEFINSGVLTTGMKIQVALR